MSERDVFDDHTLRFIDVPDGFVVALPDPASSEGLRSRTIGFLLASTALSVCMMATIVLAFCAVVPLLVVLPLMMGRSHAWWAVRCGVGGIRLTRVYTSNRAPTVAELRHPQSSRPLFGPAPAPRELAWADIVEVGQTDYSLWFRLVDGEVVEVLVERTPKADIAEVGERIRAVWERYRAGLVGSAEQQVADRARLGALARSREV